MTLSATIGALALARALAGDVASLEEPIGWHGWGVGIEVPRIGVMTGVGPRAALGWGYSLGAGLSWRPLPAWQLHLRTVGGQSYGGTARVRYLDAGREVGEDVTADWLSLDVQGGFTYNWRRAGRGWVPFVGIEAGWGYGGFDYHLPSDVARKLEPPSGSQPTQELCTVLRCTTAANTAVGGFLLAGARLGVRLLLTHWLSAELEIQAAATRIDAAPVAATTAARAAHSVAQTLMLVRPTFTLWVGL
ncbi:MAG: hypothetical protein AAB426_11310 [Myxococcota bacterium]